MSTAPVLKNRDGVRGGLLEVGFGLGEELVEGGAIHVGGGECGGANEFRTLCRPGGLMDQIALCLREAEREDDQRFFRGFPLFRFD